MFEYVVRNVCASTTHIFLHVDIQDTTDLPNVPDEMEHLEDILPDISWLDEFGPDSDSGQAGDDCQSQCESRVANNLNIGDCPPSMFGLSGRGPNKRKTAPNSEKKKRQRKRSRGDDPPFSFTVKRPDDDGKGGGCPESTRPRRSHRLKELNSRRATSSKKAVHATDHHGGGRNRVRRNGHKGREKRKEVSESKPVES